MRCTDAQIYFMMHKSSLVPNKGVRGAWLVSEIVEHDAVVIMAMGVFGRRLMGTGR